MIHVDPSMVIEVSASVFKLLGVACGIGVEVLLSDGIEDAGGRPGPLLLVQAIVTKDMTITMVRVDIYLVTFHS